MTTIRKGSRGEDVKSLQMALNLLADGIFGVLTEEAVKVFQKEHGLTPDGIVGANTWKALQNNNVTSVNAPTVINGLTLKKSKRAIKRLICHCTATSEGRNVDVATIRKWHKQQGWSDIGYHYVIYLDGTVNLGRDVDIVGAHCADYNTSSIGIVYVGGVGKDGKTPKDTRTVEQKAAFICLLKALRKLYPSATIHGHNEFANKACPSFDMNVYKTI